MLTWKILAPSLPMEVVMYPILASENGWNAKSGLR